MNLKINFLVIGFALTFSTMYSQQSEYEAKAKQWISSNSNKMEIASDNQMKLAFVKKGGSGETLRYQQMIGDVPVYNSEIIIHFNKQGDITYTSSESTKKNLSNIKTVPAISKDDALKTAHVASKTKGEVTSVDNKLYVFPTDNEQMKLAYRVLIHSSEHPGAWETIVDAQTGEVISVKDVAMYHKRNGGDDKPKKKKAKTDVENKAAFVLGSAYIFDADPLSSTQSTYAGNYVDNDDATNASLDAARKLVTIPELELTAGVYKLKGTYAGIKEIEAPTKGLFTQSTDQFLFNRNDDAFEAVNAYWHIDNSFRYINQTLGIPCVSIFNSGVLYFDPHGFDGDDNSYYDTGQLVFGEGGVDDAEDSDVIIHELGHGIHDFLTNGHSSQVTGLGEGCGDYWAQSYSRGLNQWPSTAAQYNWVFNWDGHNEWWAGRTTNYAKTYPQTGSSNTEVHVYGQIWATALMKIFNKIGKEKTDRAFLEGLALTGSSTNQKQAAVAVRQAAIDMLGQYGFKCSDIDAITQEFTTAGYAPPAYTCALAVSDVSKNQMSIYPNPAKETLTVSLPFKTTETAEIYSLDGKKISESDVNANNNVINVSSLTKGVYLLKIKGTDVVQKFIKN